MTKTVAKKFISVLSVVTLTVSLFGCAGNDVTEVRKPDSDRITIGVSIWNTRDLLGSRTRMVIDEVAEALGVDVIYSEHEYDASMLRTSVNKLCAAGCDGILFCPNEYQNMRDAIRTCDREGVYLVQYYSRIDQLGRPDIYDQALKSDHYVGAVYEDEVVNGYNLTYYLLNKGDRQIGVMCGEGDEVTFSKRRAGAELAVGEWNAAHPDDTVHLSQTVNADSSSKSCNEAVEELLSMMHNMDGLLVGSGTGTQVVGAMGALRDHGLSGKVDLVGTGFLNDMKKQLKHDGIYAESGGNICDALYAFLLCYKAIEGSITVGEGYPVYELQCPYIYISSPEEYEEYEKYFVTTMPYSREEILDLADYDPEELKVAAQMLTVRDVKTRHSEKYINEMRERKKENAGINGKNNGKG